MDDLEKLEFSNNITCQNCNTILEINDKTFTQYFDNNEILCSSCKYRIELLEHLKKQIDEILVSFGFHYGLLGCRGKITKITLQPNKNYNLDLSKQIGDGELLYINFTPSGGGLFPALLHSNTVLIHRLPKLLTLIPYVMKEPSSDTLVNVFYWYAPKSIKDDLSSMLLLDAFKNFYEEGFRNMLVSAHTSIEILQYKLLENLLKTSKIKEDRIKSFLEDKATFSVQLFTLLPFLSDVLNFPLPQKSIFDSFRLLVKDRHDVVHRGKLKKV